MYNLAGEMFEGLLQAWAALVGGSANAGQAAGAQAMASGCAFGNDCCALNSQLQVAVVALEKGIIVLTTRLILIRRGIRNKGL